VLHLIHGERRLGSNFVLQDKVVFPRGAKSADFRSGAFLGNRQVMLGQAVDLGGGVFKKRLGKNRFRSIILAKGGRNWVYEYLFAKEDLDNISVSDLANFRKLARSYEGLTDREIVELSANQDWVEIFE
jgi:hypothetical protein